MKAERRHRRSDGGFTLVEVVVALAIVALTFSALYQLLGSGLRRESNVQQYELAMMSAQSLLAESNATLGAHDGETRGTTQDGMSWERQVEPYDTGRSLESELKPFLVTVIVHWGANGTRALKVQAILLGRSVTP